MDINRRQVLKGSAATAGLGALGFVGTSSGQGPDVSRSADWGDQDPPVPYEDYSVHRVAQDGSADFEEIQAAVNAAEERDLVLIEPGRYYEAVRVNSPSKLTIRGTSRDEVIIDGEYSGYTGIEITADDVVVENLTVRHCTYGVYWTGVEGYRGSHLVANNCTGETTHGYGIYAFNARYGRFEHCYASGSDDAGFYIGESQPADAVITDCLAENNAMGYSGTNAGGNLVIKDSEWRNNMSGLIPNTLDSQEGAPQGHIAGGIRIENNDIHDNNNLNAPAYSLAYAVYGTGVCVVGGVDNDIVDNTISNQAKYGVVVGPMPDQNFYQPKGNAVMRNTIEGSGRVDLALAAPASNNRFADNEFESSRPMMIERRDGSIGDPYIFLQMFKDFMQGQSGGSFLHGETRDQPLPDEETLAELPEMEDPENEPPKSPIGGRA